jgi:cobalt-zinc-cadmium efflux system membrane fusion protein
MKRGRSGLSGPALACVFVLAIAFTFVLAMLASGCGESKGDPNSEAPPKVEVEHEEDVNVVQVEHPEQFPVTPAAEHTMTAQLTATGTVSPDVSRTVPVISLAAGRVVDVRARLGDTVTKGQVLLRVQSADMSSAFSDYRKATADEQLARTQMDRAKLLYDKGAISLNDLQVAQDAAEKANVDVENTKERLRVLGGDVAHPGSIVEVRAPVSGVITDQQVTNAAGVAGLGAPNPFTISDLSNVWILCDVYENDLATVHVGDTAEIRLNAYPDRVLKGRISNVGSVLDPSLRTAKVRIEVKNPGLMRVGMFVTATFHGAKKESRAAVPASAILHLHDRDWVYVPIGEGGAAASADGHGSARNPKKFRRIAVVAGAELPDHLQEIVSGLQAGQPVVVNALVLQNTVEQ